MTDDVAPKSGAMTAGHQLIEQGRQGGAQGVLLSLQQRFGPKVDARTERRIAAASLDQLGRWSQRMFSVATLADLFRGLK